MDKKLILRLSIYFVGLVSIFVIKHLFSKWTQPPVDMSTITSQAQAFQWCSESSGTIRWLEPAQQAKFSKLTDHALRKKFCNVELEALSQTEMSTAKWKDLAAAVDSQGAPVKLEWDKDLRVFRAQGLPFKSKKLSRELLDESF